MATSYTSSSIQYKPSSATYTLSFPSGSGTLATREWVNDNDDVGSSGVNLSADYQTSGTNNATLTQYLSVGEFFGVNKTTSLPDNCTTKVSLPSGKNFGFMCTWASTTATGFYFGGYTGNSFTCNYGRAHGGGGVVYSSGLITSKEVGPNVISNLVNGNCLNTKSRWNQRYEHKDFFELFLVLFNTGNMRLGNVKRILNGEFFSKLQCSYRKFLNSILIFCKEIRLGIFRPGKFILFLFSKWKLEWVSRFKWFWSNIPISSLSTCFQWLRPRHARLPNGLIRKEVA